MDRKNVVFYAFLLIPSLILTLVAYTYLHWVYFVIAIGLNFAVYFIGKLMREKLQKSANLTKYAYFVFYYILFISLSLFLYLFVTVEIVD